MPVHAMRMGTLQRREEHHAAAEGVPMRGGSGPWQEPHPLPLQVDTRATLKASGIPTLSESQRRCGMRLPRRRVWARGPVGRSDVLEFIKPIGGDSCPVRAELGARQGEHLPTRQLSLRLPPHRAVYLICACLKVLTCLLLSPPVRSCPEGGFGATRSEGVYFGVLQAHATTGVVGPGYA